MGLERTEELEMERAMRWVHITVIGMQSVNLIAAQGYGNHGHHAPKATYFMQKW